MKEGVGVLDGRAFVCCFCLSAKVLELTFLIGELRGEVIELRKSVEVLRKENDHLVERVIVGESDWRRVERNSRSVEVRKKPVSVSRSGGGRRSESGEVSEKNVFIKNPNTDDDCSLKEATPSYSMVVKSQEKHPKKKSQTGRKREDQQPVATDKRKKAAVKPSMSNAAGIKHLIPPSRAKEYVRRRALWGTKCMDTEEEVKMFLVSRVPEATSVEVKRMCKSESGHVRWWFWLMGDESALKLVDGGKFGEFWKVEKSPFLDSVVVRVLGQ